MDCRSSTSAQCPIHRVCRIAQGTRHHMGVEIHGDRKLRMAQHVHHHTIGAGGILRDIKHTHGALHLAELHRFTNPAEAAASLALREGKPTALNFYLDHGRIHVGDLAKTTEDAFSAWVSDRAAGLDAIMLAPTRELVAELNRAPAIIASATSRTDERCTWLTGTGPVSEI